MLNLINLKPSVTYIKIKYQTDTINLKNLEKEPKYGMPKIENAISEMKEKTIQNIKRTKQEKQTKGFHNRKKSTNYYLYINTKMYASVNS